jgi:hypothetical protein
VSLPTSGVRLTAEGAQQFNQQLERAAQAVDNFGAQATSGARGLDVMNVAAYALGEAIGTFIVRGFDAARNAVTGFLSSGWEFNKTIENASAQLKVFLGSQEAANEALAIAERRAARTPFAFEDYARSLGSIAAIQKQNGGELEDYLDLVERLAAANPAEGFEGATFALREAMSGDFLSLQDRFNIPKSVIATLRETGVTVDTLDAALTGLGYTTDLVTGLSETFDGRMSTLMDTVGRASKIFMAPIFDAISEGLFGLQGTLDEKMPQIEARLASAGQFVADAITSFRQGWEGNWVDSDIIQPLHRVAGNLGINVRDAIDKARLAWEKWNEFVQKGKDLWNSPWVQEKIITPLSQLDDQIMEESAIAWAELQRTWDEITLAGDSFNRMVDTAKILVGELSINLEILRDLFFGAGKGVGEFHENADKLPGLGDTLIGVFDDITGALLNMIEKINWARLAFFKLLEMASNAWTAAQNALGAFGTSMENNFLDSNSFTPNASNSSNTGGSFGGTASAPVTPTAPGGQGGKGPVNVSVNVVVPPNTSPRVAAAYVSDGVTQSLRSVGLA